MNNTIHLETNIITAINAIDNGEVNPIVDTGKYLYVLNTSNKELGNLIFTVFNPESRMPVASYQARFGTYHRVVQVMFGPMPISKLDKIVDLSLPGEFVLPISPQIIPGCYCN